MELNGKQASADDIAPLALYSYGSYTTMLVVDSKVRGLELHLDRLDKGAQLLFGSGVDRELVRQWIRQVAEQNTRPAIVRVTVFSRDFSLTHPAQLCKLDILVTTRPAPEKPLPSVSLKPLSYQRDLAGQKTASIGGALYRRRLAQLDGFDDALFITGTDEISEGPTWNIGFIKAGTVILPSAPSLSGISVTLLQKALAAQGVPIQTQTVQLQDVSIMDEGFIVSAGSGFRSVKAIDAHTFESSDTLSMLKNTYENIPYDSL